MRRLDAPCRHRACQQLAVKWGLCPEHQYRKRGNPSKHYKTQQHQADRQAFIQEHPICQRCNDRLSKVLNHKVQVKHDDTLALDWTNYEALCIECHNRQSAIEKHREG